MRCGSSEVLGNLQRGVVDRHWEFPAMRRGSWGALGSLWSCEAGREVSQGIPSQQCAIGLLNAVLARAMASEASRKKQVAESMAFQIFSRHNPVPSQIWAKMQIIVHIVVMSVRDFHRVPRRFFFSPQPGPQPDLGKKCKSCAGDSSNALCLYICMAARMYFGVVGVQEEVDWVWTRSESVFRKK